MSDRTGSLVDWQGLSFQPATVVAGRRARLERLSVDAHTDDLFAANAEDTAMWRYMPYGPFLSFASYRGWVAMSAVSEDPVFYAIGDGTTWSGVASYLRLDRDNGVIEIGHIAMSPSLQRTPVATEAIHLMIDQAFEAGFRRVEWKCNAGNEASKRAALRYGFTYEGTFRQHMVIKGANRDTAWFSILDSEWPALRRAHQAWLSDDNFDPEGRQKRSLADFMPNV